jgi:hypothetical protein
MLSLLALLPQGLHCALYLGYLHTHMQRRKLQWAIGTLRRAALV